MKRVRLTMFLLLLLLLFLDKQYIECDGVDS